MPFIITEPQRIEGTQLGYSVYPYNFSFQDHFERDRKVNQKLLIFKLKDSPFIEVEKILFQETFVDNQVSRFYVDQKLKEFTENNTNYVLDQKRLGNFFHRCDLNEKSL